MKISLIHDTPIYSKPRRLSIAERNQVRYIVDDLLQKGIIRPSSSPYASALVLVRKKNGEIRKCVDYRPLNKITVRDNYPLPLIDTCLEHLGSKRFFTLMDLKNGFHQIDMHEDSIKFTSFVTPDGQFEYIKMPFGLKNAPAQFQRFINHVLHTFIASGQLVVYLDDIIIASVDLEDHLCILGDVLRTLRNNGLELRMDKCKFVYEELDYLGYRANPKGIRPSDQHIQAIQNYPVPRNIKEVQRCLGLFSYFRRFVSSFSTIAKPLSNLLKDKAIFVFNDFCLRAFNILRDKLINSPVLAIYNPSRETELHCDASAVGFGSVLLQKQEDGKLHPIAYFSKTASSDEAKLHSYELETLSIIYALKRFHTYLHGIPFKIITDCNSLVETLKNRNSSAKIARWSLFLEDYNYSISHRPGSSMSYVDALSRKQVGAITDDIDIDRQLRIAQSRDPIVEELKMKLKLEPVEGFVLENGVIYKISPSGKKLVFVLNELINNIIRNAHEKLGHLGVKKCCCSISSQYWFPQMKMRVHNFVRNCLKCIVYYAPARKNLRNLHNIPTVTVPFDTLHIDHLGPLPSIKSQKKIILVVIDSFAKFTKLYAATSTSSRSVCIALEQYFAYYSRPKRIVNDRATCFTSNEFREFLSDRGITHVLTATSSSQANGQVERVNRVLRPMLSKTTNDDHSNWSSKLYYIEHALNNSVHSSTQFTPSMLLFGTNQRGPIVDELTEFLEEKQEHIQRDFEFIRNQASENITRSQRVNEEQFAKSHHPADVFHEGDIVMIRNVDNSPNTNKKLIAKFKGPYVVHKCLPNDRYVIRDIEGCQQTQIPYDGVLEADKLRNWSSPDSDPVEDSPNATLQCVQST